MADPTSISLKEISAAARASVAKALEQNKMMLPQPDHFGYFPPWWWFGFIIRNPDFRNGTLAEAQKLAADVHQGIAASVAIAKGGKPVVIIEDGTITLGFAPAPLPGHKLLVE